MLLWLAQGRHVLRDGPVWTPRGTTFVCKTKVALLFQTQCFHANWSIAISSDSIQPKQPVLLCPTTWSLLNINLSSPDWCNPKPILTFRESTINLPLRALFSFFPPFLRYIPTPTPWSPVSIYISLKTKKLVIGWSSNKWSGRVVGTEQINRRSARGEVAGRSFWDSKPSTKIWHLLETDIRNLQWPGVELVT